MTSGIPAPYVKHKSFQVAKIAREMIKSMPHLIDIEAVKKYMSIDISPLSVVLCQEVQCPITFYIQ